MLAEHGSESDAQEALKMFEAFVKVRVTTASSAMGDLSTTLALRGSATGHRLKSAAETGAKRQRAC